MIVAVHDQSSLWLTDEFLVKVCGLTSAKDAFLSIDYGANALGFNFYPPSPRYLDPRQAAKIIDGLPDHILVVAVMVVGKATNEAIKDQVEGLEKEIAEISGRSPIDVFQLHGLESESQIPLGFDRVLVATDPSDADRFPKQEILIDTSWGTGARADWNRVQQLKRSFILSGGLTPENVSEAVRLLRPAGVDVCSGVESELGVKDPVRLRRFVEEARGLTADN